LPIELRLEAATRDPMGFRRANSISRFRFEWMTAARVSSERARFSTTDARGPFKGGIRFASPLLAGGLRSTLFPVM
jgi:hypothetical protein